MAVAAAATAFDEPARSIDDVIERMRAIDAALPHDDGVAYFNRLYLKVTEEVRRRKEGRTFENADFLERLDVVFANLYFAAYAADVAGAECARAWAPLFAHRHRPDTEPVQFAIVGMNAHINHDLPLAVVTTCEELLLEPLGETPQRRDYDAVNAILRDVEEQVKHWYLEGLLARLDVACRKIDDAFAMLSIYGARTVAWEHAETLWELRDNPRLRGHYETMLARMVNWAGHGILV